MGFSEDDFIVLGIMKWHQREDPLVLIRAFKELLCIQPRARLILVGDGPLKNTVHQMLADIADKVNTPGYVSYSQLPKFYALADVFVHPAPSEPWGVSVNEAMACGVPVMVSTGVGAREDLVDEGETGFVFPLGDWRALADKLVSFSRTGDSVSIKASCVKKMRSWNYRQSLAAFESALGSSH